MDKQKNPLKIVALVNIFLTLLLFVDVSLPAKNTMPEIFDSVAAVTKSYPGYKSSGGREVINVLYCDDNNYRIGNIPPELNTIQKGDSIKIKKTAIFGKASLVGIKEKNITTWYDLTFLSNYYIFRILLLALFISAIYLLYDKALMDILLALSSASLFFISVTYLFYY